MQKKLSDCFPDDYLYRIGKIFEAIHLIDDQHSRETEPQRIGREDRISLAFSHVKTLIEAIDIFDREFTERGLQDVYIRLEIERSKYPLKTLEEYFRATSKISLNSQDARAYADSAEQHILELIKHAKNLDDAYSSTT